MRKGAVISPVTIGRAAELKQLSFDLDQARLGRGQVVAITGEAGVGKTRLAIDAAAVAGRLGMTVLRGRAVESSSPVAYRVIGSAVLPVFRGAEPPDDPALGPYRSALSVLIPEWRGRAGPFVEADAALAVLEAAARLFRVLAGQSGLLLLLEDLQWADAETLAVLNYLADTVAAERVLCLVTVRSGEPGPAAAFVDRMTAGDSGSLVALDRLSAGAIEDMVQATLATDELPSGLADAITRAAEGLPLAAEEVLADLIGRGELVAAHGTWSFAPSGAARAPAAFIRLAGGRLDRLTPNTREVLRAASLLGREFEWSLLPATTGLDESEVLASLGEAVGAQLLESGDGGSALRFRHALIQAGILGSLLGPERARIARSAANALEARPGPAPAEDVELAAGLREHAGDRHRAAALLLQLGQDALARVALASADDVLERAHRLAGGEAGLTVAIEECQADVAERRGVADRAVELARRLVRHVLAAGESPERLTAARLRLARARPSAHLSMRTRARSWARPRPT